MARWPRNSKTTVATYAIVFLGFPLLCYLAWCFVRHGF
jgi:hypothetical protein